MQSQQQMRTNTLPKLNRNILTMPKWVNEAHDRIGPKPPAPPPSPGNSSIGGKPPALPPKTSNQPEPDYEVIEFSGQQYSNEPMIKNNSGLRPKTPDAKLKCTLCGSNNPWVTCDECAKQIFCASCDDMFHKHPKRKSHVRKAIEQNLPPIPPKTSADQPGPTPPVAPPRRSKRGFPTPLLQRKNQVTNNSAAIPPPSPTPSMKSSTWHDRVDSLKRGMSLSNRPLPDTPKTPTDEMSSRSTTPKSVFDTIQRPPSVTLEKIKSKASATLDRMAILQQRYRQQKEVQEHNRSNSVADQNFPFDQWSNISPTPSHFRSGSMSSGLNSSHFDLSDDTHFNLSSRQRQTQQQQMIANRNGNLGARNMSTSVFNLSQPNRKPLENHSNWMNTQMQQAQSIAHLNCTSCNHPNRAWPPSPHQHQQQQQPVRHPDDWNNQFSSNQQLNRSNLSLNMPAMYMMPQHHPLGMYPPPVFMNQMNQQRGIPQNMYPYPYPGMPVMNTGIVAMPPTARSRATSRANSRLPSPTLSRKSLSLRKKHSNYQETDPTDDEDSDQDDRRSLISNRSGIAGTPRSRQRRVSSVSQAFLDDDSESTNPRNLRSKIRDQRRGSTAKSMQSDWTPGRHNVQQNESDFGLPSKPSKIYSDLDSESSGTRALVQAKIQQKLEEAPKQYSNVNYAVETTSSKRSTEVQADTVRNKNEGDNEKSDKDKMLAKESVGGNQDNSEEEEEAEDEEEEKVDEVHENKEENAYKTDEEDSSQPLGPPPSTPDHEWECEFCTFVNEPKVKICSICCKTPSKPPTAPKKQPPQIQVKSTVTPKSTTSTLAAPKTKTTVMKTTEKKQISNGIASTSKQSQSEDDSEATITKKKVQKNTKNSVDSVEDIWAALDENIQATAGEVIRNAKSKNSQKVSTGCGPSPPREIQANKAANIKKVSKEIGTSPPPQTISTQTYDTLPILKIDTNREQSIIPLDNETVIQNEYIDASNFKSPNIAELNATDTRSVASPDSNLSFYRDVSTFHNDRDRYRSSNDIHQSEASPIDFSPLPPIAGLGRRQSSVVELLGLQRAQSQMHTPYNLQSFPGEQSYFEYKPARDPETELYLLIKEAELYKFTSEELHVALKHCGSDIHPVQWLRENWTKLIQTVRSLATKYGQERAENTIGTISQSEAREALCIHFGNIWQAVSECIEQRQRKYREISNKGNYSREDIVTALTTQHGNVESALMDLSKIQLKPFLMRIWGSPGGIENESGTNLATSPSPTTQSMTDFGLIKSDIHDFLNANALECAQTPALAASHIKDYSFQTHSSPNDHPSDHYRQTDNLTNYSHDSKENTVSPFQLEESPLHNKSMLKDLETLIGNMEQNQAKQNEEVLRNIEGMFSNLMTKKELDPSDFGEERILMKSPINTPRMKPSEQNEAVGKPLDVKNFVWQHIQEIVPDLVQQVEKELMERDEKYPEENNTPSSHIAQETVPIQSDEMIMEILINPNIKYSTIREEIPPHFIYAAEIANFRMEFDRAQDSEQEAFFDAFSLEEAPRKFYKMFLAQKNANVRRNPQINSYSNDKFKFTPNSNIPGDFQYLNNAITEEATYFSSETSFQEKELQSEPKQTALLDITQLESNEIGAQALFTEEMHEEDSIQDQSSLRNTESSQSSNSTIEEATMCIVEVPKQLPLKRNIIQKSQEEVEKSPVISTESIQTQFEEFKMASENSKTRLSTAVSISAHPQSEEVIPSAIADEKPNVTQKPSDKKSQLPRQHKKTTVDRPKTRDNNSLKTASLQSEINSDTFTYDLEDNLEPTVPAVTKTLDDSASKFKTNEITSDLDVTYRSLPTQSEDITKKQKDIGSKETDEPKNIEIINSKAQYAAESAVGETAIIGTNEESNDSNTTNRNSRRSVKLSKIPIRRNTNINNYNNQNVKASERITVNSNKIINMSLDQTKDNQIQVFELEPAGVNSNASIDINQKASTTRNVAVVNSEELGLNLAMEEENNTTEEHADTENDENNSENYDVFQDVAEHSSDDENEENNINSIEAKVGVASQDDEHEETSDEELFSLHSNNTAAEEEHSYKSEENQETEHNQLETNMSKQADFQSTNTAMKQNGNTTMKDFVPSSDPSKQNLSELVMDTKRLIKQMKDEITMVELESSEDESMDGYSDEYENDSGETDDWDDEEGEEEEEESDFNEDDEDEYLEGTKGEVVAIADEIEDDHTETRYEYEDGEEPQGNDIKSNVMNTNNPDINIAIRSISKSLIDDNALSSDLEIDDIEHDDLKEESHELQNQNQGDSEALMTTGFNNMHSLSFGASSSITNTSTPSQTASSEIETSIHVAIPFIAETPELMDVNNAAQYLNSTVILNEELTGTQDNQPTRFLVHTTVQETSLPLTVIQRSEPTNARSNEQENSLTAQDETISTNSKTTAVTTEFQSLPPENTDTQSEAQTLLPENNESNAYISDEETPTTSKVQDDIQAITETDGAIVDNSSSLTEAVEIERQRSTNQTSSAKNLNTIVVIPQKMPKEKSNISKIPKPKDFKKSNIKSKVLLRSKSFSGPPTPIGISSVKAIQQEFLNRQTQLTTTHTVQLNPPPTVFRKKSITETISKLTKPFDSLDGPSTSAAAASLFRKRTQPRIPKKKYHETCFSDDDYQTSSSEAEPEPLVVLQRKQSVPVFRTYPSVQEPEAINTETLARNLIEEKLVESFAEAQIAAALINMKFQKDVSVWAAKECSDLDQAIGLLQQECELCMGTFALNQMVSMLKCTHKCCKECAKTYFTVQITDRSINDCNCPFCKIPELHGQNQHEDENLEYFSNLDIFLKSILEAEVHELFQRKLRDRTLLQDPNFKWCVQCSSGFFVRPKQKRLICPDCGSVTCSQCRKVWEKQHEGISCEKYLEWKENNDPEIQAQGVQQHLALHGIDCPKCKFRYSLARGGCMHFTCTQCKFEFCYGCAKPFMMGAKCNVSPYCAKLGLHAHHPRNCLFYLRDKIPLQLQFLLKENGVSFDVDPMISKNEDSTHTPGRCPVPLQKETPKGLVDTICNGDVSDKHGGLCRTHYVEYLSAKVAKARIDPLPIFDLTDCVQELRRRGLPLPERGPWDTDEIYKGMCTEIIKQKIPLETD